MKGPVGVFRFKQFDVSHHNSSMKVGVDGVLIGAWGKVDGHEGLDLGCGCGLIALMAAQRNPKARIHAVDIDSPSVIEASRNFANSPWANRLIAQQTDVTDEEFLHKKEQSYDFILSNPPFFHAGKKFLATPRELARHEGKLTLNAILDISIRLLRDQGTLSLIIPYEREGEIRLNESFPLISACRVADKTGKNPKRSLLTFRKNSQEKENLQQTLNLRNNDGSYSEEYKNLTKAFYLNF